MSRHRVSILFRPLQTRNVNTPDSVPVMEHDALNLTLKVLGSADVRGNRVVLMCTPVARALGGR